MCGIAGLFGPAGACPIDIEAAARGMVRKLAHRGPDGEGVWCDVTSGLSLAHRRLSIVDRSDAGHQPMLSHCGRYVLAFNGEIYNHQSIREELQSEDNALSSECWKGHSDTETLLAAIACWGLEKALARAAGMFAFALWDRANKLLYLARDRIGEKPIYYGINSGVLVFASELKAIRAYPGFQRDVDRDALALFLRHNVVPGPRSILRGISKLPAGTVLTVKQEDVSKGILAASEPYWSLPTVAISGQGNQFSGSSVEACDELERILSKTVSEQLLADVGVGAFLSGGIDSSAVVALIQAQSKVPVKTFTVGFHEVEYDEAQRARAVANHLGTEHFELYITPEQALATIPNLPELYDEPFADVSQIPALLVSELAKREVTVCLTGDGGDEIFGGYNRYLTGAWIWERFGTLPRVVRRGVAASINTGVPQSCVGLLDTVKSLLPQRWRTDNLSDKLPKVAAMLTASSPEEAYFRLVSHWVDAEGVVIGSNLSTEPKPFFAMPNSTLEHQMMCIDSLTYLPDDVLVKIDRAGMGCSLETRAPFLDHRVVEFAWRLPQSMKLRDGVGKRVLRDMLYRYVPKPLIDRPKMGLGVPIAEWLRGPLKEWAESLLDESRLRREGYFNYKPIRTKWTEHLSGRRNWQSELWSILMFQAWLANQQ